MQPNNSSYISPSQAFASGATSPAEAQAGSANRVKVPDGSAPRTPAEGEQDELPAIRTGSWGVDLGHLDPAVKPGDDFFGHLNGRWIEAHPIPDALTGIDQFTLLSEQTSLQLRTLIEEMAAGGPLEGDEQRVVDAYHAFLDEPAIEAAGVAPARPYLEQIARAADLPGLLGVTAEPGYSQLIALSVAVDPSDPTAHIVSLGPAALGLPGRDLYLGEDERSRAIQDGYRSFLQVLLEEAGYGNAAALAAQVFAFERELAKLHWPPVILRDPTLAMRRIRTEELAGLAPSFPLLPFMRASGVEAAEKVLVRQMPPDDESTIALNVPDRGLADTMRLIAETPLSLLKAHLTAQFLNRHAAVLGKGLDEAKFQQFDRLIRGRTCPQPRWKRAITAVEMQLGDLLGRQYLARHFPPESKAQMEGLVRKLLVAMRQGILAAPWMGEETKRQALAKLASMDTQIGYGEQLETYDGLAISRSDPLANAMESARWKRDDALARLGQSVDRAQWPFVPQTVNASYREEKNQIVFPAGILQPPFFNPDADSAVNYGAIGAIIGHEIAHAFDDQGSKYDGLGRLRNWWQSIDRDAFDAITSGLIEQYDSYSPLGKGNGSINGQLTLGENIADLAGLELTYRAYRTSLDGEEPPVIDGFSGDQRFFLAFAQVWRSAQRDALVHTRLASGPHSPPKFRVNGAVRNVDAWYAAFDVSPDCELYLPPDERVRIWS